MKVLLIHTHYQQPGGEDRTFADEAELLTAWGHEVITYTLHNDDIDAMGRTQVAVKTIWNRAVAKELRSLVRRERPAVAHFHNIFPLISPAAYRAVRAEGVPVVQTIQNYRLTCVNGLLLRDSKPCEDCVGKRVAWAGIRHACYRGSRLGSAVVAGMAASHRLLGTWTDQVDRYIVVSQFTAGRLADVLPADRVVVEPNFVHPDPGAGKGAGGYAAFVGRLAEEKGVDVLLDAWEQLDGAIPLRIAGDGPLRAVVEDAAGRRPEIAYLGWLDADAALDLVGNAAFLVMASRFYEGYPRTIVEAMARGTPVIAPRRGAMAEAIDDDVTGILFEPDNAGALAAAVSSLRAAPGRLAAMRHASRAKYVHAHTGERHIRTLEAVYATVTS